MKTTTSDATQKVLAYFEQLPEWSQQMCNTLRAIILQADKSIVEEWKWGPHYSSNGMVCGIGAFQKHVKLTFFNGVAMKDAAGLFNHCLDNEFLRSIKYNPGDSIDKKMLTQYVKDSVAVNANGFKRIIKDKNVAVPTELMAALQQHKEAHAFFEGLSYGYKKEFAEHVTTAKQEKTRVERIRKIIELCAAQKTLHHMYKK